MAIIVFAPQHGKHHVAIKKDAVRNNDTGFGKGAPYTLSVTGDDRTLNQHIMGFARKDAKSCVSQHISNVSLLRAQQPESVPGMVLISKRRNGGFLGDGGNGEYVLETCE